MPKHSMKHLVFVLVLLAASQVLAAAERREIGGRTYVREARGWQAVAAGGRRFDVEPRVITVRFRPGVDRPAEQALHGRLGAVELRRERTGFVDLRLAPGEDPFAAIDDYLASGLGELAEPNTVGEYALVPDDPFYGSQWHLPRVLAKEAWDLTAGSPGAVVAVLDSGTDFDHDDLGTGADGYQNVWHNPGEDPWPDPDNPASGNGADDDGNGYVDDWQGWNFADGDNDPRGSFYHGTAVAGVTAAKTDNGLGVAGVAGGANAAGARVLIAGVGHSAPVSSVLDDAILYASELGADVIQLSLTVGESSAIDAALAMAYDDFGVTIVCASGNGGVGFVGYPSSDEHVIAVGSTDPSDRRSSFSRHGVELEIAAPGEDIWTLDLGNGYGPAGGTSFAAPLVSGVVALMLARDPTLTPAEIRHILRHTADQVGGYDYGWNPELPGHSLELGYGRVNALRAVSSVPTAIFADGFERGNLGAWSSSVP